MGGFKSIKEFFDFVKVKPHIESQLRDLVTLSEIKGLKNIELKNERTVDL